MIVHEILQSVEQRAQKLTLADLRIGVGYTAVALSDGSCGVSYTFRSELGGACGPLQYDGPLEGESAWTFAQWAAAPNMMRSVVGVATLNALLREETVRAQTGNIFDNLALRSTDKVGMVGAFCPQWVSKTLNSPDQLYIFERNSEFGVYPDWAMEMMMPQCDVAIITATTFITKTLDNILAHCTAAREVILVGATLCHAPEILKAKGVTLLAGARVTDTAEMLRIVSHGGGGKDITRASEQTLLRL